MPPPPLSTTTIRRGRRSRRAARPPRSWARPRSPSDDPGRAAAGVGERRCRRRSSPSIPFAPRLQRKARRPRPAREEGLLVADRHARGGVDAVAVAVGARRGAGAGPARSSAVLGRARLDRRPAPRARPPASAPAAGPPLAAPGRRAAPPSPRPARSGRRAGSPPRAGVGSFQPPGGSTTIWSAPRAGEPGAQRLAGRHARRSGGPGRARAPRAKCSSRSIRS